MFDYFKQPVRSSEKLESYHTIFGFDTTSKVAASAIDIIYWFIIAVAYAFAFHALNTILISWNWFLVALASLAVVGLPYCVKIILFGRKTFPAKAALLCGFLSILPTVFDFAGLYSETGLQDSLNRSKTEIVQSLTDFEAQSRRAAQQEILNIQTVERGRVSELEEQLGQTLLTKQKELEDVRQEIIDEKTGVQSNSTSGRIGTGPRTRELEATVRRLEAQVNLEQKNLKENVQRASTNIREETKEKIKSVTKSVQLLDTKIVETKQTVLQAHQFHELELATIDANSLLSSVASNLNIEFQAAKITGSSNILNLSFSALFNLEITALVCMLLAILMEIGDIVIVYVIRYEKPLTKTKIVKIESKPYLYQKRYDGY